ncbi:MAG: group I intron-associated PD-(D/E)XK endonuclease [Candidatus Gracilibacteria bacterium]|nr:group I intron-associated PD-(D/E)XK endonuclease [Candidatus Gracilibacteria bacterium]
MDNVEWTINLTRIDSGVFRTMNGNADEMIAVGRVIKAGFPCSRVDVTNAKYDAIVDIGGAKKLLRIQIKGTGNGSISFTGGIRSGQQISRDAESRKYKYTEKDCDLILGIDTNNGECYIIPIADIKDFGDTKTLSKLQDYKENWKILIDMAKDK